MYWVLQNNIYSEEGFDNLCHALQRLDVPYGTYKVVPFVGTLDPDPELPPGSNAIVMGSYSLARHAVARGWKPGAFLDNLDFEIQRKYWEDWMLNYDAEIYPFGEIPFQSKPFFLRPVHDTKAFTGLVLDWGQYEQWRDGLRRCPETIDPENDPLGVNLLTLATPVMVCSKKEIFSETRCWVVNGNPRISVGDRVTGHRVVTASGYKIGTLKRYSPPEEVDQRIIDFANGAAAWWSPNDAYVLDIADTPDGLKIVEVNNLNSAGFYKADMNKLVMALESL